MITGVDKLNSGNCASPMMHDNCAFSQDADAIIPYKPFSHKTDDMAMIFFLLIYSDVCVWFHSVRTRYRILTDYV
jgi:hypothetical protein